MKIYLIGLLDEVGSYLNVNRLSLMIGMVGAIFHIAVTKNSFKEAILKIISSFIGALLLAPAVTEYYSLGIKANNVIVLVTYYLIKGMINESTKLEENPVRYILSVISNFKNAKDGNNSSGDGSTN